MKIGNGIKFTFSKIKWKHVKEMNKINNDKKIRGRAKIGTQGISKREVR